MKDVVGIGNAIVDVIARHDDAFLETNSLSKGSMHLVDEGEAHALYEKLGPATEISGGSAANTIAGIASLGGTVRYIGKVSDDQLGEVFSHDIRASNVAYDTAPLQDGPRTARCIVIVTPDGQRTMSTFLGSSAKLGPEDIDGDHIKDAQTVYLEGYLWDRPDAKAAFRKAARIARQEHRAVALTLSDTFCVDRHRDSFLELIRQDVTQVFANEAEIKALYETEDLDAAVSAVRQDCPLAVVTRSELGCVIVSGDETIVVAAEKVNNVVDTTGAGDLFAAGFLFGQARGMPLAECGRIGAVCAAEVITHIGARPVAQLRSLL